MGQLQQLDIDTDKNAATAANPFFNFVEQSFFIEMPQFSLKTAIEQKLTKYVRGLEILSEIDRLRFLWNN